MKFRACVMKVMSPPPKNSIVALVANWDSPEPFLLKSEEMLEGQAREVALALNKKLQGKK